MFRKKKELENLTFDQQRKGIIDVRTFDQPRKGSKVNSLSPSQLPQTLNTNIKPE